MSKEMITALDILEKEKGIKKEVIVEALEAALVSAFKRNYGQAQNVEVEFNDRKGDIHVYAVKKVVEEVEDDQLEVTQKRRTRKSKTKCNAQILSKTPTDSQSYAIS